MHARVRSTRKERLRAWITDRMHHCVCCVLVILCCQARLWIYLTQLSYLKERSYLKMQEIFNKVEQNQLQRTKNVVYFLDAGKNTFDFRTLATEPKWVVGHHPLVNSGGGWSCHKCQRERLRGITDFLQSFSWYFHRAWDRSRLPEIMSCFPNIPREGWVFFPLLHFSRKIWWNEETVWSSWFLTLCLSQ